MRRNKHGTGFKLKPYNQTFEHEGSTWDIICKSSDMIWAVELDKKGNAGGAVVKFPV